MTKTIGEKILELRKARSLTQEKLGEQLGISSQAVSKWENGDSMPDILLLPQLCEILGISIDALLEVPQKMKKENILNNFREYAKEIGYHKAIHEAFKVCSYSPFDDFNINTIDDMKGLTTDLRSDHMIVTDMEGLGFIIANNEYMDKIRDYNVQNLVKYFELFANEEIMTIVKELLIAGYLSKEELLEKTSLSLDKINNILLILIEKNMCMSYYHKIDKKDVYTIDIRAYSFHMTLTAYLMSYYSSDVWHLYTIPN